MYKLVRADDVKELLNGLDSLPWPEDVDRIIDNLYTVHSIELSDDSFGAALNCAVRYCLGRQTYMPSMIVEFIRPLLPYLNKKTVSCMWNDIRYCNNYGDPQIDEPLWMDFLKDLVTELESRDSQTD